MKYRKKPVVIEAWQVSELERQAATGFWSLPKPIIEAYERGEWVFGALKDGVGPQRGIYVPTLEGSLFASPGDWIICGVKGEFYPCSRTSSRPPTSLLRREVFGDE